MDFQESQVQLQENSDGTSTLQMLLLGEIDPWWGLNSESVYQTLRQHKNISAIDLVLSSPGGSVTDALIIYNMLKSHSAKVIVYPMGLVASAATIIASAADEIHISKQCIYMIHRSSAYASGNANELEKTAGTLRAFDELIVDGLTEGFCGGVGTWIRSGRL